MSVLLDLQEDDKDNKHLQEAINEWQKVYDQNKARCVPRQLSHINETQRLLNDDIIKIGVDAKDRPNETWQIGLKDFGTAFDKFLIANETVKHEDERRLRKRAWDPFHSSLHPSIYHWGYWGSLTEPPCSTFVAWRVLTKPAYISKSQLAQMRNILFTNRNEKCEYTSVHYKGSVARPTQPSRDRLLYKCSSSDYVSDKMKEEMRKKTGNPKWCC